MYRNGNVNTGAGNIKPSTALLGTPKPRLSIAATRGFGRFLFG